MWIVIFSPDRAVGVYLGELIERALNESWGAEATTHRPQSPLDTAAGTQGCKGDRKSQGG